MRPSLAYPSTNKLRLWLGIFFLALAIPTGILIYQAYSQLKWETFHQHQLLADELATRIDKKLITLINNEEARSFAEYAFLNVVGDPAANFMQRSPLSSYPVTSSIPGVIGYFQVDTQGTFSTPLLPQTGEAPAYFGLSVEELKNRQALHSRIQTILSQNRLVQVRKSDVAGRKPGVSADLRRADIRQPARSVLEKNANAPLSNSPSASVDEDTVNESVMDDVAPLASVSTKPSVIALESEEIAQPQAAFDRLNQSSGKREQEKKQKSPSTLGRVEDLKLVQQYQTHAVDKLQPEAIPLKDGVSEKRARKERSALPESRELFSEKNETDVALEQSNLRISIFESELDPLEFSFLDSGHFVIFRKVWRNGHRYIQGMLLEQKPFLDGMIQSVFLETALSRMSDLIVAYQGEIISVFSGQSSVNYLSGSNELGGALLHQTRLSAPLSQMELIFSINKLPIGPGGKIVTWIALIITLVLIGGFYLMYRLGLRQIELGRQQQDFVSAVSHELKTPLTSIRMYGEMLREGWAPEEKKQSYYDFIFDESERLSRLIENVLQLARLTRNEVRVELKPLTVAELIDNIRSRVSSHIEHAGFSWNLNCEDKVLPTMIKVDADSFSQIIINLVDNALKFSAKSENKTIDIECKLSGDGKVQFSVRDYGPGVARDQMKKIFKLFYRSANELTRDTVGTGIGLALVHQLAQAMDGRVDVINRVPGAEFRVLFPVDT